MGQGTGSAPQAIGVFGETQVVSSLEGIHGALQVIVQVPCGVQAPAPLAGAAQTAPVGPQSFGRFGHPQ
jgi:hypothetical protein